ncbi:MAG: hypothetical protein JW726_13650 [Anaerolineales bacterium]|nr:hypothetical protein [Anaerolineales bacterium]
MNNDRLRQLFVIVAVILTIAINGLANALPINNQTTGEISDRFTVFFVPAGYVFSIWGLIYLGLIAYAIFQALPAQSDNPRLRRIGYIFVLSSIANIAWIFLWHYNLFELTLLAMLILLASLIAIYLILGIGRSRVSALETWMVRVPFSIYLGWITVATVANVTSLLDYLKWDGFGIEPQLWAVIMLIVATLLGAAVGFTRRDVAYLLVLVWAFIGIAVKHSDTSVVAIAAYLGTFWVLFIIGWVLVKGRHTFLPQA